MVVMFQKSYSDDKSTLFLVPTPVGNLEDITYRAINILNFVDLIACEDKRVSIKLLKHFNIKKRFISINDNNENEMKDTIVEFLKEGKNVAIISDAGSPIICDPGYKIVKIIIESGYNVVGLPGPTAFVPALTVSGLRPYPFVFIGFLNSKPSIRKKEIEKYKNIEWTMIFYETPHRIEKTLNDMNEILGNRNISIAREISKIYEEVYRGTIIDYLNSDKNVKGEMVLVVEGSEIKKGNINPLVKINEYILKGMSKKDAIDTVSSELNLSKREVYNEYHRGE